MQVHFTQSWPSSLATFFLAGAAAASLTYWALQWPSPGRSTRLAPAETAVASIDSARLARLLGQAPDSAATQPAVQASTASRFVLVGVIAQGSQHGSALIAVDGAPAKPFRVGETVADGQVLQRVNTRSITLAVSMTERSGIDLQLPLPTGAP